MSTIPYVWTPEDERIAKGDSAYGVQGPYVTPYGIRAVSLPGCEKFAVGAEQQIELDLCMAGEPWRGSRFREGTTARVAPGSDKARYKWDKAEIPDSVTTISELCKHLHEKDPNGYPESIYGEKMLASVGHPDNPAKLLFDYWKNSALRCATVRSGFDWSTYANDPGSIKIRKDKQAIQYVMRKLTPLPQAAAAPGAQKKTIDDPALEVEHYIAEVQQSVANIRMLLGVTEKILAERYQIIYRLRALRAIAEASFSAPQDGKPSQGAEIVKLVDEALPKVHEQLATLPIQSGTWNQQVRSLFQTRKEFTMDAVADLRAEEVRLRALLLEKNAHAKMLKDWALGAHAAMLNGQPRIVSLIDRLTTTLGEGHLALAECAADGHDDVLEPLLKKMRDDYAKTPAEVDGASPTEVALSLVGKGVAITTTAVGNLAGPPSLSIAILQAFALRRFPKIVAEGLGALSQVNPDLTQLHASATSGQIIVGNPSRPGAAVVHYAIDPNELHVFADFAAINRKFNALAGNVFGHLPDGELKSDLMHAFAMGDQKAIADLKDKYGEAMAGSRQVTVPWKRAMVLLGLISVLLALREASGSSKKHELLVANDYVSLGSGVVAVTLGSYETFLTMVGRLEPVAQAIGRIGCAIGIISSVTGAISSIASGVEAWDANDWRTVASSGLAAMGSVGMGLVAAFGIAGTAMPVAAAVSLACLLASGVVSVEQVLDSLQGKGTKTNQVCFGLVRAVRTSFAGRLVERSNGSILLRMEDIEKLAKDGALPNPKNDYFVLLSLVKAGFSEALMREIVNASSLATSPIAPGLAPGVTSGH